MSFGGVTRCTLLLGLFTSPLAFGNSLLSNGSFASGVIGWTSFITGNGTLGGGPFATDGVRSSNAVEFQVGEATQKTGDLEGGGIFQSVSFPSGHTINISANIAVLNPSSSANLDGVTAEILIDSMARAMYNFNVIQGGQSAALPGDAAQHILAIQFLRSGPSGILAPIEFVDGVTALAVPEPTTAAFLLIGLALVAVRERALSGRKVRSRNCK